MKTSEYSFKLFVKFDTDTLGWYWWWCVAALCPGGPRGPFTQSTAFSANTKALLRCEMMATVSLTFMISPEHQTGSIKANCCTHFWGVDSSPLILWNTFQKCANMKTEPISNSSYLQLQLLKRIIKRAAINWIVIPLYLIHFGQLLTVSLSKGINTSLMSFSDVRL